MQLQIRYRKRPVYSCETSHKLCWSLNQNSVFRLLHLQCTVWFLVNQWKSSARFSKQKCKRSLGSTLSNLKTLCCIGFQHIKLLKKYSYSVTVSSPVSKNFTDSHHKTIFTNEEIAITVFSTCNSVKNAVFCFFPWGLEGLVTHESLLSSKQSYGCGSVMMTSKIYKNVWFSKHH